MDGAPGVESGLPELEDAIKERWCGGVVTLAVRVVRMAGGELVGVVEAAGIDSVLLVEWVQGVAADEDAMQRTVDAAEAREQVRVPCFPGLEIETGDTRGALITAGEEIHFRESVAE